AGHAGAHVWKVGREHADRAADRVDPPSVAREVALVQLLRDEKKEQALVRGKVVSRVRLIEASQRKCLVPGREIHGGSFEAADDLGDDGVDESKIRRAALADSQVEEAERQGVRELLVEPLQEPHQGWPDGVAPDELVVIKEAVAESDQIVNREVEQPAPVEEAR